MTPDLSEENSMFSLFSDSRGLSKVGGPDTGQGAALWTSKD